MVQDRAFLCQGVLYAFLKASAVSFRRREVYDIQGHSKVGDRRGVGECKEGYLGGRPAAPVR
jgi:hypothetical protein